MLTILFLGAVAIACLLAGEALFGLLRHSGERDRRLRWVERHPDQVNSGDIRKLLARELTTGQVELVCTKARDLGVAPFTMWLWIRCFDVRTLALAVAADTSHAKLLAHLGAGVAPDVETLEVFAAINGLQDVATPPSRRVSRPLVPAVKRLTRMPEITDPGGFAQASTPARERPAAGGEGSFAA
jgi:hypothetical protein